jgi:hypothetical protein
MSAEDILITLGFVDGGFTNWKKWNDNECAEYIKGRYNCSDEVSKKVGAVISKWLP